MNIGKLIAKAYGYFVLAANWLQPVVLLLLRLTWGWQFFFNGRGKLMHHPDIVDYFTSLGIPFPDLNAWFVGGVECFGGILLLLGLAARPTALILTINMTVAFLADPDDRKSVMNVFKDLDPVTQAAPFMFWLVSLIVLAFGPGLFSLDALINKLRNKQPDATSGTDTAGGAQPT